MRDLAVLVVHLLATVARLAGPGGTRAVVAESILVKQQLLIVNRSRRRSFKLRPADRVVAGLCTLLMRPSRLVRAAIVLKPSTLLRFHRALTTRKYQRLFSSTVPKKPGPKGPSPEVIAAVADMKQRNPTWGCPRIAQQIALSLFVSLAAALSWALSNADGGVRYVRDACGRQLRSRDVSTDCIRSCTHFLSKPAWNPHCEFIQFVRASLLPLDCEFAIDRA